MSDHTLLVNKVIGQCTKDALSLLRRLGFVVHVIEPDIGNGDVTVMPDIVLTSQQHKLVLVIECKSGANVNKRQDYAYSKLSLDSLIRHLRLEGTWNHHVVAYAINEEHLDRIRQHTKMPLIVFGHDSIRGIGDFGVADVTRVLDEGKQWSSRLRVDTSYYKFSLNDNRDCVDAIVLERAMAYLRDHFEMHTSDLANHDVANKILQQTHRSYAQLAKRHRHSLELKIIRSIKRMNRDGRLAAASRPNA